MVPADYKEPQSRRDLRAELSKTLKVPVRNFGDHRFGGGETSA
jgi:hypothetical protein